MKRYLFAVAAVLFAAAGAFAGNDGVSLYSLDNLPAKVYYASTAPITQGGDCRTAVVLIHGWGSGIKPISNYDSVKKSLGEGVYLIAPNFPTHLAMEKNRIEEDGRAMWNDSWQKNLTTNGSPDDDWRGGGDARGTTLSSFDVIDSIFTALGDRKLYPKLRKVTLMGFSAGGQFVGRYVAVGRGFVRKGVKINYIALSPSTQLRMDPDVKWHYGLADRPRYGAGLGEKEIMHNLETRPTLHGCGTADVGTGSLDVSPEAMLQGENRYDRCRKLEKYIAGYPKWKRKVKFHYFEGIAHEAGKAYADPVVIDWILER